MIKNKVSTTSKNTEDSSNDINDIYNEFSLFYTDLDELKKLDDNKKISQYLLKNYKTIKDEQEFISFFYNGDFNEYNNLLSKEFSLVGIYEDLYYYPFWMSDNKYREIITILKQKYDIFYWRRIKGDGNCFYRAILIIYLEYLISESVKTKRPSLFFNLIKDISFIEFPSEKEVFHKKLITVLLFIYEEIKNQSPKCFDILYRTINLSDSIEKSIIYWLKLKIKKFLKNNLHLEINGIKLIQSIPGIDISNDNIYDEQKIEEYINNKLMKMNEYAEGYILYITPFLLKCNINIFTLYGQNVSVEKMLFYKDLKYKNEDNFLPYLNRDFEINILFKSPHYDCLSNINLVQQISNIYDNKNFIFLEGNLNENEYDKYKTEVLEYNYKHKYGKKHNKKNNNKNSLETKFTESENVCDKCNKEKTLQLPCGCIICGNCSYLAIKTKKLIEGNLANKICICKCGYEISEKDCNMIQQFIDEN